MAKYLLILIICSLSLSGFSQSRKIDDSIVQLYGIVMYADSLQPLYGVSIIVDNGKRGTMSNYEGVFSIAVKKGDIISFSSVGFKTKTIQIPFDLVDKEFAVVQMLNIDTVTLPAVVIKQRPSREEFERDFLNSPVIDDAYAIANKNINANREAMLASMPRDGREAVGAFLNSQARASSYKGGIPPQGLFNVAAWANFIKAWKKGGIFNKKKK